MIKIHYNFFLLMKILYVGMYHAWHALLVRKHRV